ncbi:rhodanese-like domain-containing protein [Vibrio tapetis]|uniref:Putative rhodanese-related sulfurtransferase n=1 Tax=Vibrio tapetis subsp. tapetis TaxID=1671868 RepID=A0A2N8ZGD7_9VIBR|nr:rhodanese-like domain-containing protein [Vibrio tapetis]MDN3679429.1 rhodanese-like domain-containing protein [Vibrio tapetis subsp. quintayensis]SON50946.1 putative rhodanese-related sulfurtransferase [Vibrio tapetis subsp. tapetis]
MQEYMDFISQNMIMVVVWAGLFVALIMNIVKAKTAGYKEVTPAEVTQFINRDEGVVIDIRSLDEYKQGHITGAVHILPSDIKNGSISSLEKYKSSPITVVCKTGQTAVASANELAKAGFENVHLLKNGLIAWNEANMPLVRGKK